MYKRQHLLQSTALDQGQTAWKTIILITLTSPCKAQTCFHYIIKTKCYTALKTFYYSNTELDVNIKNYYKRAEYLHTKASNTKFSRQKANKNVFIPASYSHYAYLEVNRKQYPSKTCTGKNILQ